ncbi:MAG: hypothetical protein IH921_14215 [Gemmatimonadetes bacterium]|nr:hypothetical protein [Gemmatimonadota bacterium]
MGDSDHEERRKSTRRKPSKTRLLDDRRAGPGRRIWARRTATEDVDEERRKGAQRAGEPRRSGKLRRQEERRKGDRRLD